MLEMGETVTKKYSMIVGKFQTSESNLAKQQYYGLHNQNMKEIRRFRKSNKKNVKKARGALTRVMQHLQTFAENIEQDKDVPVQAGGGLTVVRQRTRDGRRNSSTWLGSWRKTHELWRGSESPA